MEQERSITRAMAQQSVALIEGALDSGSETPLIELWGQKLVLRRDHEGGWTVDAKGVDQPGRVFGRSAVRPQGYPDGLPFVENEIVFLSESGRIARGSAEGGPVMSPASVLSWMAPADPDGVFAKLAEQCFAEGWVETKDDALSGGGAERRVLEKAEWIRHLMMTSEGMVSVIEFGPP